MNPGKYNVAVPFDLDICLRIVVFCYTSCKGYRVSDDKGDTSGVRVYQSFISFPPFS